MEIQTIQERLEGLMDQSAKIYEEYHKAKTKFDNLDEMKKTFLSVLTLKYEGSEAKIKRLSEADSDYKEFLEGLNEAKAEYNQKWARVQWLQMNIDILRSLNRHLQ